MSTKRIILISGYARSGKDSLATALEKHLDHREPVRVKFANVLKTALGVALQRIGLDVDVFTEDEQQKQSIRPLLVEFGKFARSVDKDVFVKAAWRDICDLFENGKGVVIVPDLRYVNEINLISEWTAEKCWAVTHLRISRMGNRAANDEELQSINALPRADAHRIFAEGNIEGIDDWAEELCSNPCIPVPMPTIAVGGAILGNQEYAQTNKGTKAWTHGAVFGHTHDPKPAPVEQQLKALWDESLCLDETIDRVSQRVDDANDRLISIGLTLERIDARLKRLEVARG